MDFLILVSEVSDIFIENDLIVFVFEYVDSVLLKDVLNEYLVEVKSSF